MNHIKTYFKEGTDGARAEVFLKTWVYTVSDITWVLEILSFFAEEMFEGKSRQYAEDAAENWALRH